MKPLHRILPLAIVLSSALASYSSFAQSPASVTASTETGSKVFEWDKLTAKKSAKGESRFVIDTKVPTLEKIEMHVTTLNPGNESHPPHHHPQEEIILISAGKVQANINGKSQTVGPGSMLFFAAHDVHNAKSVGDVPATYYVINFYTTATGKVQDKPAAEYAPADKLKSSVIDFEKLTPNADGTRRVLVDSPTLTYAKLEVHSSMAPVGAPASKAHRHPWVQVVIVREGTLETTLDGKTQNAGPGSIVYLQSNAMQSLKNVGDVPAKYWVVSVSSDSTPKPSDS